MKNKVRKFLPAYKGPYFVVGLLDDLVYRIKKNLRARSKVGHHDRLKPYYSRSCWTPAVSSKMLTLGHW